MSPEATRASSSSAIAPYSSMRMRAHVNVGRDAVACIGRCVAKLRCISDGSGVLRAWSVVSGSEIREGTSDAASSNLTVSGRAAVTNAVARCASTRSIAGSVSKCALAQEFAKGMIVAPASTSVQASF